MIIGDQTVRFAGTPIPEQLYPAPPRTVVFPGGTPPQEDLPPFYGQVPVTALVPEPLDVLTPPPVTTGALVKHYAMTGLKYGAFGLGGYIAGSFVSKSLLVKLAGAAAGVVAGYLVLGRGLL